MQRKLMMKRSKDKVIRKSCNCLLSNAHSIP